MIDDLYVFMKSKNRTIEHLAETIAEFRAENNLTDNAAWHAHLWEDSRKTYETRNTRGQQTL
jgi:hypothetical protein